MNQILPYLVWVGHAGDGCAFAQLFDKEIRAVVQLVIEEPAIAMPREILYLRFPLFDGEGNEPAVLQLAVKTVSTLIEQNISTLVCCSAGMSRSPLVTAAALMPIRGTSFAECLRFVTHDRPADISPALLFELRKVLAATDSAP